MATTSTSTLEAQLQSGSQAYQKLQTDFANAVESRQRLDAQKAENESVKKEFATLQPSNQIYKLVGPVLLKQDQTEAKANVDHRLELIGSEIKRVEAQLAELETKLESKKMEVSRFASWRCEPPSVISNARPLNTDILFG
ncbi:KE2 family protein [Meredithblackwellia eburnea MCA 4105]